MIPVTDAFPPVSIIIPTSGLGRYVTFEMSMEALHAPEGSGIWRGIGSSLAAGVNEAIAGSRTPLVWFLDDDHAFDPQLLLRLIAHDVPVVVPLTTFSRPPFNPVLFKSTELVGPWVHHNDLAAQAAEISRLYFEGYELQAERALASLIERGPLRRPRQRFRLYEWADLAHVAGLFTLPPGGRCGRSGMLVKREVFEAIPPPWFELGQTNSEEPGEDMLFAGKVQAAGYPIMVDLEQANAHIAPAAASGIREPGTGRRLIKLEWENGQSLSIPVDQLTAPRPPSAPVHHCREGWVCALHPDQPPGHLLPVVPLSEEVPEGCPGAPKACDYPGCVFWESRLP